MLLAGAHGVATGEPLAWQDCEVDPAGLTENDRRELRVAERLPAGLGEALGALRGDEAMVGLLGEELVEGYAAVKEFEMEFLGGLSAEERRRWILARY